MSLWGFRTSGMYNLVSMNFEMRINSKRIRYIHSLVHSG